MFKVEKDLSDALEVQAHRALTWRENAPAFTGGLLEALEALEYIDPRWTGYTLDVVFSGTKVELIAVWKILRANGWKTDAERPKEKAEMWYGSWHKEGCEASIWVNFMSKTCVRKQVGTQMKEVPVYDIVCGEPELEKNGDLNELL